jgi:hypothetical protein
MDNKELLEFRICSYEVTYEDGEKLIPAKRKAHSGGMPCANRQPER